MNYPADWDPITYSRKPICGVLATATCGNTTFAHATQLMKKHLPAHRKRHGGKTYHSQRMAALTDLGVEYLSLDVQYRITLQRFVAEGEANFSKTTRYMISTTRHVVSMEWCNATQTWWVQDQCECSPIADFTGRRCFVKNVTEILSRGD